MNERVPVDAGVDEGRSHHDESGAATAFSSVSVFGNTLLLRRWQPKLLT